MSEESLQIGISFETSFIVAKEHTAQSVGSGAREVLSTPTLVAMVEKACEACIFNHLKENEQSVGVFLDILHNAPTPVGMEVHVRVSIKLIKNREVHFEFIAKDESETIAKGSHARTIAPKRLFDRHLAQKIAKAGSRSL